MARVEFPIEALIFLLAVMFVYEASFFLWDVMLWHWWVVPDISPKRWEPFTPHHITS
jgi:hypothetical protein